MYDMDISSGDGLTHLYYSKGYETIPFYPQLFLCVSRACLGKVISFMTPPVFFLLS